MMTSGPDLLYGLNDRPGFGRTVLYGLQWLVLFLPMLTVVSVLLGQVLGLSEAGRAAFFQRLLLVNGLTLTAQSLWGHRLPLLDGPALALVITMAALASAGGSVIQGGMMVGGLAIAVLGFSGWMKYLAPLFTDRVVGVILLLIGLTVLPYLVPMMTGVDPAHPAGRPLVLVLGLGLALAMTLMTRFLSGLWQSLSIFWGVLLGAAVFWALGLADFGRAAQIPWLTPPGSIPGTAWPRFELSAALSFVLAYLAVLVNAAGSVYSLEPLLKTGDMDRRLNRGLVITGLSGILSGGAGVVGTVPFATGPGVITFTRVASRFPITACGLILTAMAFLGKLTAWLSAVPEAVVGAALLVAMASAVGVSLEIIRRDKTLTNREYLVVGLPVLFGVGAALLPQAFLGQLPGFLRPLVGNGLIVGLTLALLMEHLVLPEKKE